MEDFSTLFERIKHIAQDNPKGFTITVPDLRKIKRGWSVALKETQRSFGDEGLKKVLEVATEKTGIIGGWNENGEYWYDAVRIFEDEDEATQFGIENEQLAIFNIDQNVSKWLK